MDRRNIARWAFWLAVLALTTAALIVMRTSIEQTHAAFALLLIVLGGSAGGGRTLGYVLAVLSFLLIDYYFQTPYGFLSVGKPLDWVVLASFLASAFVATELLTRARDEADTARSRTDEVVSLSRLGSETLRYARADDALAAVTALIRDTLHASWCTVRGLSNEVPEAEWTSVHPTADAAVDERRRALDERIARVAGSAMSSDLNHNLLVTTSGALIVDSLDALAERRDAVAVGIPLFIESRPVGVLVVGGDETVPVIFDAARRRFIETLSYYAALGLERVRLSREAAQAHQLREASRAKDEVLASVSHDLRTPLTTIKLLAHGAAERGDPAGALIADQTDRLANLVTNVLDLSRIRSGGVTLDLALNTAEDVIAAAISRSEGVLHGRQVVNRVDLERPAMLARFDFVQTLRILGNFIDNALRYTREGGIVYVSAAREGAWLVIAVVDQGSGVPPAERERIFDAFYRPRSEAPDAGHAGLGLSIARRLAELQGGTIDYAPNAGGGSIFSLRLPAVDLTAAEVELLATSEGRPD